MSALASFVWTIAAIMAGWAIIIAMILIFGTGVDAYNRRRRAKSLDRSAEETIRMVRENRP